MTDFTNQVAVITGAGKGIGKEIAKKIGLSGGHVCLLDVDESILNATAIEFMEMKISFETYVVDITAEKDVENVFAEINKTHNKVDILVNNAGIIRDNLLFKMSTLDWDQVMNVHLKGAFICSKYAQELMVKNAYGRIINLSSVSALGNRGQANYATAKAGIQGFTKTLALELGRYNITVNAVAPGFIVTEMTKSVAERNGIAFEQLVEEKAKQIPVKRAGMPEDVAHAVCFFASKESSFVSGQVLYVAGGPKA